MPETLFARTTYRVTLQSFGLSVAAYPTPKENIVVTIICTQYQTNSL